MIALRSRNIRPYAVALLMLLLTARAAVASTITLASNGTPQQVAGLNDIMLRGELNGALVTATFADSSAETRIWSGSGVSGTNWALTITLNVNTFIAPWQLSNTRVANQAPLGITSIVVDAGPTNAVFDRTLPAPGTTDSNLGLDFTQLNRNGGLGGTNIDTQVTYFDIVQVDGNAPVGDLYRQIQIEFGSIQNGIFTPGSFTSSNVIAASILNPNGALNFLQDTDSVTSIQALQTQSPGVVPEPASLVLFGTGIVGALVRRRRSRV